MQNYPFQYVYSLLIRKYYLTYLKIRNHFRRDHQLSWTSIALFVQLFFGIIIGLYFWNLLKNQRTQKVTIDRESKKRWNSSGK